MENDKRQTISAPKEIFERKGIYAETKILLAYIHEIADPREVDFKALGKQLHLDEWGTHCAIYEMMRLGILDDPAHDFSTLTEPLDTHIYLMRDTSNNSVKIGKSGKPQAREKTLQCKNRAIELMIAWEGRSREEKILHEIFQRKGKHIRGEWFDLTDDDIELIKTKFEGRNVYQIN